MKDFPETVAFDLSLNHVYFFLTRMNCSISELQQDIQRLTSQQNQIHQHNLMAQHQQQIQQQFQQLQSLSHQHLHVSLMTKKYIC